MLLFYVSVCWLWGMQDLSFPTKDQTCTLCIGKSESESHSVVSYSWQPHGLHSPWNSLGQNTEVGRLSLLQGIFPTQGSNSGLLHCRWILYQLSHKGSHRIESSVSASFESWWTLTVSARVTWPETPSLLVVEPEVEKVCSYYNYYPPGSITT